MNEKEFSLECRWWTETLQAPRKRFGGTGREGHRQESIFHNSISTAILLSIHLACGLSTLTIRLSCIPQCALCHFRLPLKQAICMVFAVLLYWSIHDFGSHGSEILESRKSGCCLSSSMTSPMARRKLNDGTREYPIRYHFNTRFSDCAMSL